MMCRVRIFKIIEERKNVPFLGTRKGTGSYLQNRNGRGFSYFFCQRNFPSTDLQLYFGTLARKEAVEALENTLSVKKMLV